MEAIRQLRNRFISPTKAHEEDTKKKENQIPSVSRLNELTPIDRRVRLFFVCLQIPLSKVLGRITRPMQSGVFFQTRFSQENQSLCLSFVSSSCGFVGETDYPFTQTTCRKVCAISTRSLCAFITSSMGLYAIGVSSITSSSFRHSMPSVALA